MRHPVKHEKLEAILFDFDGVLADTEPLHWACWNEIIAPLGIHISWEAYVANCIGISDRAFLKALGEQGTPPRSVDELLPTYPKKKKLFRDRACSGRLVTPETKAMLRGIQGLKTALVTSSATLEISAILKTEGLLDAFDTKVYGEDVRHLKPHPEPYLTAMRRLGVTRALVVEDSKSGIASGRAAGCEVLAIERAEDVPRLVAERLAL